MALFGIQFHVDNLSSAHVYLRLRDGESWDDIEADLLTDCAQLTKENSIKGSKKDNITIIYTPWSNLKKDQSMDVGQVSFKDPKKVKKIHVATRDKPIINRLEKTRLKKFPNLLQEKQDRLRELGHRDRQSRQERAKEEARVAKEYKEAKWAKEHAYDDMFTEDAMAAQSNQDRSADWEDDFM